MSNEEKNHQFKWVRVSKECKKAERIEIDWLNLNKENLRF